MIVGCYSLHLYCVYDELPTWYHHEHGDEPVPFGFHAYREFPAEFDGRTEAECKRQARKRGWKFRDGDVLCPRCAKGPQS